MLSNAVEARLARIELKIYDPVGNGEQKITAVMAEQEAVHGLIDIQEGWMGINTE
jgi:hypothetical protein